MNKRPSSDLAFMSGVTDSFRTFDTPTQIMCAVCNTSSGALAPSNTTFRFVVVR